MIDSDAESTRPSFVGLASFDGEKTDALVDDHTAASQESNLMCGAGTNMLIWKNNALWYGIIGDYGK